MEAKKPSILMLPWLAHGHISPFLELAKKLCHKNFIIYFCSTNVNLEPIKQTLPREYCSSIQLVELELPSTLDLPPHYHTTKDLPPQLMSALKAAFDASAPAFVEILKAYKPNYLIYDFLQPWAPIAAEKEGIEPFLFLTTGAAFTTFSTHCMVYPNEEFNFSTCKFSLSECKEMSHFLHHVANGVTNWSRFLDCMMKSSRFVLIKTSREIEGKYFDRFTRLLGKRLLSLGPMTQGSRRGESLSMEEGKNLLDWLSKKGPKSSVFVSFGSEYFLLREEIEEIAYGLELSEVNFIWVIRFHGGDQNGDQRSNLTKVLPNGFLERVGDKGIIVEGWAPQVKILEHPSIGGFVSHCGWSSTLEGVMLGVPIIAMPLQLDQPVNAKVVAALGVGLEVRKEKGIYKRDEIARVIRQVVVLEEGEFVKKHAQVLSQRMREKGDCEFEEAVIELLHK